MTNRDQNGTTLSGKIQNMLDNSEVPPEQQEELLRAMLGLARGITDDPNGHAGPDLNADFTNAFEPLPRDKVDMLLAYRDVAPGIIVQQPNPITALSNGQSSDPEAPYVVTPRILRRPAP
jgi:hypothetical protein